MMIKEILKDNPVVLAPMAGITDHANRLIIKEHGCGLLYTEMISAKALTYHNSKTIDLMNMEGEQQPISMQIFGSQPKVMVEGAKIMANHGAKIIDINMGCPVPKVVKNQEGSALMRDIKLASDIVRAMVKQVGVPITVKIRKGWDEEHINAVDFAKAMEESGVSAIAVHGRTRSQYYAGKADWDIIAQVKEAVSVPVIGNGDIFAPEDGKKMLQYTNCDAVMIGRGGLGKPWLFGQVADYIATGTYREEPTLLQRNQIILQHAQLVCKEKGEQIAIREMRKHVAWYYKGVPNSARLREEVNKVTTFDALQQLIVCFGQQY